MFPSTTPSRSWPPDTQEGIPIGAMQPPFNKWPSSKSSSAAIKMAIKTAIKMAIKMAIKEAIKMAIKTAIKMAIKMAIKEAIKMAIKEAIKMAIRWAPHLELEGGEESRQWQSMAIRWAPHLEFEGAEVDAAVECVEDGSEGAALGGIGE